MFPQHCVLSSLPSHREDKAAGDPYICHTHPAETDFNEWLNVQRFGLEIKAHRVTGGF